MSHKVVNVDGPPDTNQALGDPVEPEEQVAGAEKNATATYSELFRFATTFDIFCMVIGCIAAGGVGAAQPCFMIIFGDVMDGAGGLDGTGGELLETFNDIAYKMIAIGGGCFVAAWVGEACFKTSGLRQSAKWRTYYLEGILRQDVSWYDTNSANELSSRIADSTKTLEEGISSKLALGCRYFGQGLGGVIVAFAWSWDMSLVLMALSPIVMFGTWFMTKTTQEATESMSNAYAKAGGVASETIGEIRTVSALGAEGKQEEKYVENLEDARKAGVRSSLRKGFANGLLFSSGNIMAGVGFIYAAYKIAKELERTTITHPFTALDGTSITRQINCQTPWQAGGAHPAGSCAFSGGYVLIAIFALQMGCQGLGLIEPSISALAKARKAAKQIMQIADRRPIIDVFADTGRKLKSVTGNISLENVDFSYPSRPNQKVCDGYNLTVEAGTTVALVGASGSGKSTTIQLVERFYDPDQGVVKLDGTDLRELNVSWLRQQIGLVSQEPVLFSGTIAENIAYGKPGASREEVEAAAKMSNAHNFITEFSSGYDTNVGEKGGQLSGGQKQRVAIARAMIKNPSVLLLDEATSALDTESERVVQAALDELLSTYKRTTIVIAHRLTTIRNADKICVVNEGRIVEQGTHEELMAIGKDGYYFKLNDTAAPVSVAASSAGAVQELKSPASSSPTVQKVSASSRTSQSGVQEVVVDLTAASEDVEVVGKPVKKTKAEIKADKKNKVDESKQNVKRLWKFFDSRDKALMALGAFGALIVGGANPGVGVIFVKSIGVFYVDDADEMRKESIKWALVLIGIAFAQIAGDTWRFWGFGVPGEKLTVKVRQMFYNAILRQEIGWHDLSENASGILCASLAQDLNTVQALTGEGLGQQILSIATLAVGFTFAFIFGYYQITLIAFACIPIMISGMMIELALMSGGVDSQGVTNTLEGVGKESGRIVGEVTTSIRTIAAFTLERQFQSDFNDATDNYLKENVCSSAMKGFFVGYSQGSLFFAFALLYWFGGRCISQGKADFEEMFIPIFCMFMMAAGFGQAQNGATDAVKAKGALKRLFDLVDRNSKIDFLLATGRKLKSVTGNISLENVDFSYPSRPNQKVCDGYNLTVEAGTTVALVGASGSGKSTTIQLVERFYDPDQGVVKLDGTDLRELNVSWLRQQIGLVSQEPVLFSGTIAENIAYGKPGASREEVEAAAKMSNAHNFITEFSSGYDTNVGEKGGQLSGGQKQRVAIARAMIKNPSVLLLDEATSALDTESERVVQAALDELLSTYKRTTIVIAHRLTTIRNADKICVVNEGRIVEQGTHEELMAIGKDGYYFKLISGGSQAALPIAVV